MSIKAVVGEVVVEVVLELLTLGEIIFLKILISKLKAEEEDQRTCIAIVTWQLVQ